MKNKVVTADEAVAIIHDGDTLCTSGFVGTGAPEALLEALERRFLDTEGTIHNHGDHLTVRLNRRAYSPVLRAADLPPTPVPWWGGRTLHYEFA